MCQLNNNLFNFYQQKLHLLRIVGCKLNLFCFAFDLSESSFAQFSNSELNYSSNGIYYKIAYKVCAGETCEL